MRLFFLRAVILVGLSLLVLFIGQSQAQTNGAIPSQRKQPARRTAWRLRASFEGFKGPARYLQFTPDGKTLVSCNAEFSVPPSGNSKGEVSVWDVAKGNERYKLKSTVAVDISPDGKTLAAFHEDSSVILWDVAKNIEAARLGKHDKKVSLARHVKFSPDGSVLASGADSDIKLWKVATTKEIATCSRKRGRSAPLVFSPDGTSLFSQGTTAPPFPYSLTVWRVADGKETGFHEEERQPFALSPDGKTVATVVTGDETTFLTFRDPASWKERGRMPVKALVKSAHLLFSPDGKTLAATLPRGDVVLLVDVPVAKLKKELTVGGSRLHAVAYTPDGTNLVVSCTDGSVRMLELATGKTVFETAIWARNSKREAHLHPSVAVAMSHDGRMLALASHNWLRLWEREGGPRGLPAPKLVESPKNGQTVDRKDAPIANAKTIRPIQSRGKTREQNLKALETELPARIRQLLTQYVSEDRVRNANATIEFADLIDEGNAKITFFFNIPIRSDTEIMVVYLRRRGSVWTSARYDCTWNRLTGPDASYHQAMQRIALLTLTQIDKRDP